jgi:hypothetical protein
VIRKPVGKNAVTLTTRRTMTFLQLAVALLLLLATSQAFLPGITRLAHSPHSRQTKSAQQPTPASATAPAPAVAAKKAEGVEPERGPLDISLKDEILFIKRLLIPALDSDNELETSKERKEWMKKRAKNTNWDAGVSAELILIYGTVNSLEKAQQAEAKAERLQAEAKAERLQAEAKAERLQAEAKAERALEKAEENDRKRGKSSIICSSSSFSCLLLSCMISCS